MKNNLFKWLKKESIESPIFWLITEEMVQEEAEQEIDRRLTEEELKEIFEFQYDDESFCWDRMVLIREAINRLIEERRDNDKQKR